jgi:hypothetical protein
VPSFDMEPTSSAPSTSASSPTASGSTVDTATDDIFVRHRVSRNINTWQRTPKGDKNRQRKRRAKSLSVLYYLQVRKRDTLAGLAVKYNVTVS